MLHYGVLGVFALLAVRQCSHEKQEKVRWKNNARVYEDLSKAGEKHFRNSRELEEINKALHDSLVIASKRLKTKPKTVTRYRYLKAHNSIKDSTVIIYDTVPVLDSSGFDIIHRLAYRKNGLDINVNWTQRTLPKAFWNIEQEIELEQTTYLKKMKGWFWKFKWGKGKWEVRNDTYFKKPKGATILMNEQIKFEK